MYIIVKNNHDGWKVMLRDRGFKSREEAEAFMQRNAMAKGAYIHHIELMP